MVESNRYLQNSLDNFLLVAMQVIPQLFQNFMTIVESVSIKQVQPELKAQKLVRSHDKLDALEWRKLKKASPLELKKRGGSHCLTGEPINLSF